MIDIEKKIKEFKIAEALALQRESYEQRIKELERQNKIWVEIVGNLHSKIFSTQAAGDSALSYFNPRTNEEKEAFSNWRKAKGESK